MLDALLEILGFLLLITAAGSFSWAAALIVAGVGLIIFANRPTKPKGDSARPS